MDAEPLARGPAVFINCPFDPGYRLLFEAIVFAVYDCGAVPRCALERDDASEPRVEKILRIIGECPYAIHDLSRTELTAEGLPRFNMPLELGMFLGAKTFGDSQQRAKQCLIFDREPERYLRFCSDIRGMDISVHGGSESRAVHLARNWFRVLRPEVFMPSGSSIEARYAEFIAGLPEICQRMGFDRANLLFIDYVWFVQQWLLLNPLPRLPR